MTVNCHKKTGIVRSWGVTMKFLNMVKAAVVAAVALLGAGQAQAVIFQHGGTFTVTEAQGGFNSLLGQQGTFAYFIDYSARDLLPSTLEGPIPNAVLGLGFSLGGETFFKSLSAELDIIRAGAELQLLAPMGVVTSTIFGDFRMLFVPKVNYQDIIFHPSSSTNFGLGFAGAFHSLSPTISLIGFEGADDQFVGQGTVTSTSQFVPPQVGDPVPNPFDPPQDGDPLTTVPVPAALPLMLAAIGGLFLARRRRRTASSAAG